MKRLIILAFFAMSACASPPAPAPAPPPVVALPTIPLPPPPPPDSCGAGQMQWLVGQPKSRIPVPTDPGKRRVACTTCPVTMDYNPARLNIYFDADTGLVKEVKCG